MAYMCLHGYGECDGCGYCTPPVRCPVCGEEVGEQLYSKDGGIIGCDQCIDIIDIENFEE